jgi:hypothetical protein
MIAPWPLRVGRECNILTQVYVSQRADSARPAKKEETGNAALGIVENGQSAISWYHSETSH